jgi:hypothetical protein
MERIDILTRAHAEAEMMKTDAPLIERRFAMLRRARADEKPGARADAVKNLAGDVVLDRHTESFNEQTMIERSAARDVADGELDVRYAVRSKHGH